MPKWHCLAKRRVSLTQFAFGFWTFVTQPLESKLQIGTVFKKIYLRNFKIVSLKDIVIATPGRFVHLCVEMGLKLNGIEYVVFDEADR